MKDRARIAKFLAQATLEEPSLPRQILCCIVSEFGVSTSDIKSLGRSTHSKAGKQVEDIATMIEYFQMGPRTGVPVYTDKYAEKLIYELHTQCPSGKLTGLLSIQESREYPVIKGEIIKIKGYCLRPRT